jgi:hypothetical protein
MEPSDKPVANPSAIFQETGDGWAVLVNLDTARSLALNPSGILVWQLVDGQRSVHEITAGVERHFRDTPPSVTDDVTALLDILVEEGMVGFEWPLDAEGLANP